MEKNLRQVMEEVEVPIEVRAMEALGSGFDLASDFKLKFAKGRVVALDESNKRDIVIPGGSGGVTIRCVSEDIRCDKGDRMRFKSDVLELNQVKGKSVLFNSNHPRVCCVLTSRRLSTPDACAIRDKRKIFDCDESI